MKKLVFFTFLFFLTNNLFAQSSNLLWAKRIGSTSNDIVSSVVVDANGNVYTAGAFSGTIDFDPGPLIYTMTAAGDRDIYVSKLDAAGNFIWAKQMGGVGDATASTLKINNGNIYITGGFSGTIDFDPGPGIYNLTSTGNIFISKLDDSGNFLWAKQMGASETSIGSSVIDAEGGIYMAGDFYGTADFDPGIGIYNLTAAGDRDIFVSKLDAGGNFVWAIRMGGSTEEIPYSLDVDVNGGIYTTGFFIGTTDFDPGPGIYNLTSVGYRDIFISKLDAAGNFIWAKQVGGANDISARSIVADTYGGIYTTGDFNGTADFDPGQAVYNLNSGFGYDAFVYKLDASGNFLWVKQFRSELGGCYGSSITVDINGNIYTTGSFTDAADFDPGQGIYNLTTESPSEHDAFITKFDASGNFLWAKEFDSKKKSSSGYSLIEPCSITVDVNENIFITGSFIDSADFEPGPGIYNLTSAGDVDIFVVKLGEQSPTVFNPNFLWAKQLGGTSNEEGLSTAIDRSGNVYTIGYFNGITDFDPGPGSYNLTSSGSNDIFISKIDALGNFVWAKQLGGTSLDLGFSIAIDDNGNVYTTGCFFGTVDFDPGSGTYNLISAGGVDIFVSKLDSSGNFVWAKQLSGASDEYGQSIAIDGSGNVYTTGFFRGTADFDPGAGTYNLSSTGGFWNIFVSKLDAFGNFIWAKQMGGTNDDYAYSISVDGSGNVYTTGWLQGTADFDPGGGTFNLSSAGNFDIFISKLDASGNFVWAKRLGGTSDDRGYSIKIDVTGNVYTTGFFQGTADFDPGTGTYNLTTANNDIFISKLDASGNFVWAKQLGGGTGTYSSITIDNNGNVYTTGSFTGAADFDPGPAIYNLTSVGGVDVFICKLNTSGIFLWATQIGGTDLDRGYSIAVDANSKVYLSGIFAGTSDFDPGTGTYNITSFGGSDVYVAKFEDPLTIVTPQIFLDKALIQFGQTNIVWGKHFTPNGQIKINISSQSPNANLADTIINANSQGYFNFTYHFVSSLAPGIYNILATDLTTLRSSYLVRLVVVSTNPITTRDVKITSPVINSTAKLGMPIKIAWFDKPSHISTLIQNTSQVNASYKIEYNKDNLGWQLIIIKTYKANYRALSNFQHNFTPSQTGVYKFRVTDNLDALNTDVSANINVGDPITGVKITYEWDWSGNTPNDKPIGVAADGTARIYVKVLKKAGNNKTISNVILSVNDPAFPAITETRLLGKLRIATDITSYSLQANTASLTSVNSNTSGSGNIFWFWYVAPDDFVRNDDDTLLSNRDLNFQAAITYSDNTTDNVSAVVEIVRPPVMFVHGIGGNETTWDDFYYSMNNTHRYFTRESDSRWKFRRALNMFPGGSYIQNAQLLLTLTNSGFKLNADVTESYNSNSFQYFLKQMRAKGYSCNRVDYVAHSMGGDMARTAINYYSSEYNPNVSIQRKFKNYGNGFINKLTTLNTPHNGSPVADLTIENLSQRYLIQKLFQAGYDYSSNSFLIGSFFNTVNGTNKLDFNSPTEALKNLRYGINGVKFLTSTVKNHLIAGDLLIGGEDCLDAYNIIKNDNDLGLIYKLFTAIGGTSCIAIDEIFVPYGVSDFIENSDFVVPLSSELPGKNLSGSGNDYSIYYGVNPSHLSIHNSNENPSVGQKVFSLLNAPINSVSFANTIVANTSPGPIIYRPTSINNLSEWIDTSKIVITNPVRGFNHTVDSTINISVRLKDTLNFKYLNILFQSEIYFSASKATNQNFNVQINPIFVDSQMIVAAVVYDSLGYDVEYTDTLSVKILKDSVIYGFYITPKTKYLNSGQTYIPTYNLIHNSYITNVSILDTALHIVLADTNVVIYSNIKKDFTAKDTGTTYTIISYKQFKDTLFININDPVDENIIRACPQSNITFFAGSIDNTKNYQWQVDSLNGFVNINPSSIYSGVDSSTLTLINPPTNWYNYKYRCIISDSAGYFISDVFTLKFVISWIGISDTAWENTANWSCGSLPDSNTDVTISAGKPRYPQVNTNVSCRSLSLQPSAAVLVKTGYRVDIVGKNE